MKHIIYQNSHFKKPFSKFKENVYDDFYAVCIPCLLQLNMELYLKTQVQYFFTQVLYCLIVIVLRLCHWLILANQVQLIHIYYKWCHYQGFFYEDLDLRLGRKKKKWNMINIITLAVTFDKKVTGFKLTKSNQDKNPLE